MAASPQLPPWRSSHASPPAPPPKKSLSVFGVIALAVGAGALGYYVLDGHSHTCDRCGHRWRHLGAFNFADLGAHTCARCGAEQFWKDGFQHVFPDPRQASQQQPPSPPPSYGYGNAAVPGTFTPPSPPPPYGYGNGYGNGYAPGTQQQEIRGFPQPGLPSGTFAAYPRGVLR